VTPHSESDKSDEGKMRPLTVGENRVLRLIQKVYGGQNTEAECFFRGDDVAIFVKDSDGSIPIYVNLSVVSSIAERDNLSDKALVADWLRPQCGQSRSTFIARLRMLVSRLRGLFGG